MSRLARWLGYHHRLRQLVAQHMDAGYTGNSPDWYRAMQAQARRP